MNKIIVHKLITYGEREAIRYEELTISYKELADNVKQFGNALINLDLEAVAICMDNKMNIIVLALSCMYAKIPFIVIDKNNPGSFIQNILFEANISSVICESKLEMTNIDYIVFEKLKTKSETKIIKRKNTSQDKVLFYIATSGSTGKPKVAERFSSAFWKDYEELETKFSYLFGKVAQQNAKLNFSFGLENSLLLLFGGTTLCLGGQSAGVKNLELMYREIENNKASIIFWSTPIIKLLSKHFRLCEGMPECIEYIYTGGEPLVVSADLIVEFHNRNITLINDYGCSEIGKLFTYPYKIRLRDMQNYNMVGVGKPLKGFEAVILDETLYESDEGYLHLKSVEKFPCSYVNKLIKTSEFQKDGFWFYNMHDIAKWDNDEIIILGRGMNSVNIAGYRVELEQVEYAVSQITAINMCVAIPIYNQYREASLYCFFTGDISSQELRNRLNETIPDYMIPSVFTNVEQIFLLPNGKVDRKKNNEVYGNVIHINIKEVDEVKDRIYQYLKKIVGNEIGDLNSIYLEPFSDYGVDSLSIVDFISTVEEKEHVLILGDGIGTSIKCLKDVIDLVNNARGCEN